LGKGFAENTFGLHKRLISKDYYLVGAVFWGNSGPGWVDKVAEAQLKQASLLLYRLKDE
jgi:hypothetical protein